MIAAALAMTMWLVNIWWYDTSSTLNVSLLGTLRLSAAVSGWIAFMMLPYMFVTSLLPSVSVFGTPPTFALTGGLVGAIVGVLPDHVNYLGVTVGVLSGGPAGLFYWWASVRKIEPGFPVNEVF